MKKINKKIPVIIGGALTSASAAAGIGVGINKEYQDEVKTHNNYIKIVRDKYLMLSSEEKKQIENEFDTTIEFSFLSKLSTETLRSMDRRLNEVAYTSAYDSISNILDKFQVIDAQPNVSPLGNFKKNLKEREYVLANSSVFENIQTIEDKEVVKGILDKLLKGKDILSVNFDKIEEELNDQREKEEEIKITLSALSKDIISKLGDKNKKLYEDKLRNTQNIKEKESLMKELEKFAKGIEIASKIENPIKRNRILEGIKNGNLELLDDLILEAEKESKNDYIDEVELLENQLKELNKNVNDPKLSKEYSEIIALKGTPEYSKKLEELKDKFEKHLEANSGENQLVDYKTKEINKLLELEGLSPEQKEKYRNVLNKEGVTNTELNKVRKSVLNDLKTNRAKEYAKDVLNIIDEPLRSELESKVNAATSHEEVRKLQDEGLKRYNEVKKQFEEKIAKIQGDVVSEKEIYGDVIQNDNVSGYLEAINRVNDVLNKQKDDVLKYAKEMANSFNNPEFTEKWITNFESNFEGKELSKELIGEQLELLNTQIQNNIILTKMNEIVGDVNNVEITKIKGEITSKLDEKVSFSEKLQFAQDKFITLNKLVNLENVNKLNITKNNQYSSYVGLGSIKESLQNSQNPKIDEFKVKGQYNYLSKIGFILEEYLDELSSSATNEGAFKTSVDELKSYFDNAKTTTSLEDVYKEVVKKSFDLMSSNPDKKDEIKSLLVNNLGFKINDREKINFDGLSDEAIKDELLTKSLTRFKTNAFINHASLNKGIIFASDLSEKLLNLNVNLDEIALEDEYLTNTLNEALNRDNEIRAEILKQLPTFDKYAVVNEGNIDKTNLSLINEFLNPSLISSIVLQEGKIAKVKTKTDELKEELSKLLPSLSENHPDKNIDVNNLSPSEIVEKLNQIKKDINAKNNALLEQISNLDANNPNKDGLLSLFKEAKEPSDFERVAELIKNAEFSQDVKKNIREEIEKLHDQSLVEELLKELASTTENNDLSKLLTKVQGKVDEQNQTIVEVSDIIKRKIERIEDENLKNQYLNELNTGNHTIDSINNLHNNLQNYLTLQNSQLQDKKRESKKELSKLKLDNPLREELDDLLSNAKTQSSVNDINERLKEFFDNLRNNAGELIDKLGTNNKEAFKKRLNNATTEADFENIINQVKQVIKQKQSATKSLLDNTFNSEVHQDKLNELTNLFGNANTIDDFNAIVREIEAYKTEQKQIAQSLINKLVDKEVLTESVSNANDLNSLETIKNQVKERLQNAYNEASSALNIVIGSNEEASNRDILNSLNNLSNESDLVAFKEKLQAKLREGKETLKSEIENLTNNEVKRALLEEVENSQTLVSLGEISNKRALQEVKERQIEYVKSNSKYADQTDGFVQRINEARNQGDVDAIIREFGEKQEYNNNLELEKDKIKPLIALIDVNSDKNADFTNTLVAIRDNNELEPLEVAINGYLNQINEEVKLAINKLEGDSAYKTQLETQLSNASNESAKLAIKTNAIKRFNDKVEEVKLEVNKVANTSKKEPWLSDIQNANTISQLETIKQKALVELMRERLHKLNENVVSTIKKGEFRSEINSNEDLSQESVIREKINNQLKKEKGELEAKRIEVRAEWERLSVNNQNKNAYETRINLATSIDELSRIKSEIINELTTLSQTATTNLSKINQSNANNFLTQKHSELSNRLTTQNDTLTEDEYNGILNDIDQTYLRAKSHVLSQLNSYNEASVVNSEKSTIDNLNVVNETVIDNLYNAYKGALTKIKERLVGKLDGFKRDKTNQVNTFTQRINNLLGENVILGSWLGDIVSQVNNLEGQINQSVSASVEEFNTRKQELIAKLSNLKESDRPSLQSEIDGASQYEDFSVIETKITNKVDEYRGVAKSWVDTYLEGHSEKSNILNNLDALTSYETIETKLNEAKTKYTTKLNELRNSLIDSLITQSQKQKFDAIIGEGRGETTIGNYAKLLEIEVKINVDKKKTSLLNKLTLMEDNNAAETFRREINEAQSISSLSDIELRIDTKLEQEANTLNDKKRQGRELAYRLNDVDNYVSQINEASTSAKVDEIIASMNQVLNDKMVDLRAKLAKLEGSDNFATYQGQVNDSLTESEIENLISEFETYYRDDIQILGMEIGQWEFAYEYMDSTKDHFEAPTNEETARVLDWKLFHVASNIGQVKYQIYKKLTEYPNAQGETYHSTLKSIAISQNDSLDVLTQKLNRVKEIESQVGSVVDEYKVQIGSLQNEIDNLKVRVSESNFETLNQNVYKEGGSISPNPWSQTTGGENLPETNEPLVSDYTALKERLSNHLLTKKQTLGGLLDKLVQSGSVYTQNKSVYDNAASTDEQYSNSIRVVSEYIDVYKERSRNEIAKIVGATEYNTVRDKINGSENESVHNEVINEISGILTTKREKVQRELNVLDGKTTYESEFNTLDTFAKLNTFETKIIGIARDQVNIELGKLPSSEQTPYESEIRNASDIATLNEIKERIKNQVSENNLRAKRAEALVEINKLWDTDKTRLTSAINQTRDLTQIENHKQEATNLLQGKKEAITNKINELPSNLASGFNAYTPNNVFDRDGNTIASYLTTITNIVAKYGELTTHIDGLSNVSPKKQTIIDSLTSGEIDTESKIEGLKSKYSTLQTKIESVKTKLATLPVNNAVKLSVQSILNNHSHSRALDATFYDEKINEINTEKDQLDVIIDSIRNFVWEFNHDAKTNAVNEVSDPLLEKVNSVDKLNAILTSLQEAKRTFDAKLEQLKTKLNELSSDDTLRTQIQGLIDSGNDALNSETKIDQKIAQIAQKVSQINTKKQELSTALTNAHKHNTRLNAIRNLGDGDKDTIEKLTALIDEVSQIQQSLKDKSDILKTYLDENFATTSSEYTKYTSFFKESNTFNENETNSEVSKYESMLQNATNARNSLDTKITNLTEYVENNVYDSAKKQEYKDVLGNKKHNNIKDDASFEVYKAQIEEYVNGFARKKEEVAAIFNTVPNNNDQMVALLATLNDTTQTNTMAHLNAIENEIDTFKSAWDQAKQRLTTSIQTNLGTQNRNRKDLESKLTNINEESLNTVAKIETKIGEVEQERRDIDAAASELNRWHHKMPENVSVSFDNADAFWYRREENNRENLANVGTETTYGIKFITQKYKDIYNRLDAVVSRLETKVNEISALGYTNDNQVESWKSTIATFRSANNTTNWNSESVIDRELTNATTRKSNIDAARTKFNTYSSKLHSSNEILVANAIDSLNTDDILTSLQTNANNVESEYNTLKAKYDEVKLYAEENLPSNNVVRSNWENTYVNNTTTEKLTVEGISNVSKLTVILENMKREKRELEAKRTEIRDYIIENYPSTTLNAEERTYLDETQVSTIDYAKDILDKLNDNSLTYPDYWNADNLTSKLEEVKRKLTEYDEAMRIKEFGKSVDTFNHEGTFETNNLPSRRLKRFFGTVGTNRFITQLLPQLESGEYYEKNVPGNSDWVRVDITEPIEEGLRNYRRKNASGNIVEDGLSIVATSNSTTSLSSNDYRFVNAEVDASRSINYETRNFWKLTDGNTRTESRWDNWAYWKQPQPDNKITLKARDNNERLYGRVSVDVRMAGMGERSGNYYTFPESFTIKYSSDGENWTEVEDQSAKHVYDWFNVDESYFRTGLFNPQGREKHGADLHNWQAIGSNHHSVYRLNIKFKPVNAKYIQVTWKPSHNERGENWIIGFTEMRIYDIDPNNSSYTNNRDNVSPGRNENWTNWSISYNGATINKRSTVNSTSLFGNNRNNKLSDLLDVPGLTDDLKNILDNDRAYFNGTINDFDLPYFLKNLDDDKGNFNSYNIGNLGENNTLGSFYNTKVVNFIETDKDNFDINNISINLGDNVRNLTYELKALNYYRDSNGKIKYASFMITFVNPSNSEIYGTHFFNLVSDLNYTKVDVDESYDNNNVSEVSTRSYIQKRDVANNKFWHSIVIPTNQSVQGYSFFVNTFKDTKGAKRRILKEFEDLERLLNSDVRYQPILQRYNAILKTDWDLFKSSRWFDVMFNTEISANPVNKESWIVSLQESLRDKSITEMIGTQSKLEEIYKRTSSNEFELNHSIVLMFDEMLLLKNMAINIKLEKINNDSELNDLIDTIKTRINSEGYDDNINEGIIDSLLNQVDDYANSPQNRSANEDRLHKWIDLVKKLIEYKFKFIGRIDASSGIPVKSFIYNGIVQELLNSKIKNKEVLEFVLRNIFVNGDNSSNDSRTWQSLRDELSRHFADDFNDISGTSFRPGN